MKTQTSIIANQVRLQQWAEQIKDCQSRPKGIKVETWCEKNGISKTNYYYRLRCVREALLEQVEKQSPKFVELPSPTLSNQEHPVFKKESHSIKPVAILRGPNNISANYPHLRINSRTIHSWILYWEEKLAGH